MAPISDESVINDFWSYCLTSFQEELPAQQFNSWIRSLRIELEAPGRFRLLAPNRFVLQWVRERYLARIEDLLRQFHPDAASITLSLDENPLAVSAPTANTGLTATAIAKENTAAS